MVLIMKKQHKHADSRRQDIIRAGLDCFTQKGFTQTTMSDICKTANASTGSVYHHYKSKEQLAQAIYLEGIRTFQEGMIAALERETSAESGIKTCIAYHIQWVDDHPDWAKFLFQQRHAAFMQEPDELHKLNKAFVNSLSGWFSRHFKTGTIKSVPWDILMSIISGPCQSYTRFYLGGLKVSPPEDAIKILGQSAWDALRGDAT